MSSKLNFKAQLAAFRANTEEYIDNGCYFFYDWFCSEKALKIKSKLLMTKAEKVMSKLGLDPETHYVFLKEVILSLIRRISYVVQSRSRTFNKISS